MEISRVSKVSSSKNKMRDYINIKAEHNYSLKYTYKKQTLIKSILLFINANFNYLIMSASKFSHNSPFIKFKNN